MYLSLQSDNWCNVNTLTIVFHRWWDLLGGNHARIQGGGGVIGNPRSWNSCTKPPLLNVRPPPPPFWILDPPLGIDHIWPEVMVPLDTKIGQKRHLTTKYRNPTGYIWQKGMKLHQKFDNLNIGAKRPCGFQILFIGACPPPLLSPRTEVLVGFCKVTY